jgi:hypothetical protein
MGPKSAGTERACSASSSAPLADAASAGDSSACSFDSPTARASLHHQEATHDLQFDIVFRSIVVALHGLEMLEEQTQHANYFLLEGNRVEGHVHSALSVLWALTSEGGPLDGRLRQ